MVAGSLEQVLAHLCFVDEDRVVAGSGGSDEAGVRHEVKVIAVRLDDVSVDDGPSFGIAAPVGVIVGWEEADVVAFAADDEGYGWVEPRQGSACFCQQRMQERHS